MRWRPSQPAAIPAHAQPVPDADALRRALLAASWQRDRVVSRRRLAWRWLIWGVKRHGLKLLAVGALTLWAATLNHAPWGRPDEQASAAARSETPQHPDAPHPHVLTAPGPSPTPVGMESEGTAAPLRLSASLQSAQARTASSGPVSRLAPADLKNPPLTFDYWLHSKEL